MANKNYSKKPMSEKELAKRGGFNSLPEFRQHRHGHQTFEVETERQKNQRELNHYNRDQSRKRTDVDLT